MSKARRQLVNLSQLGPLLDPPTNRETLRRAMARDPAFPVTRLGSRGSDHLFDLEKVQAFWTRYLDDKPSRGPAIGAHGLRAGTLPVTKRGPSAHQAKLRAEVELLHDKL